MRASRTDQHHVTSAQKSVSRQVDQARRYAAQKGWAVADEHVYVDDGVSGAEFARRPGFLRLMNAVKPCPDFQVLVMSEESRLGREAIETAYALKQIITSGVRVFFYLEDRERTLETPTDKILLSLTTFADELERDRARQRTYDALERKARAGHVTGGTCFGYRNVEVVGPDGRRSHVAQEVDPAEAGIVRQVFELCGSGLGQKAIAKQLNAEGARAPRAQQGRLRAWSPSSVRAVLFRERYRGVMVWNRTRKRDRWGQRRRTTRAEAEWVRVAAPALEIVDDERWEAAHRRLGAARQLYLKGTKGRPFRPAPGGQPVEVSPHQSGAVWRLRELHEGAHPEPRSRPGEVLRVLGVPRPGADGLSQWGGYPDGGREQHGPRGGAGRRADPGSCGGRRHGGHPDAPVRR